MPDFDIYELDVSLYSLTSLMNGQLIPPHFEEYFGNLRGYRYLF